LKVQAALDKSHIGRRSLIILNENIS